MASISPCDTLILFYLFLLQGLSHVFSVSVSDTLSFKCSSPVELPWLTLKTAATTFLLCLRSFLCYQPLYICPFCFHPFSSDVVKFSCLELCIVRVTSAESDFWPVELSLALLQFIPLGVPPEWRWWEKCWGKKFTSNLSPARTTGERKMDSIL